MEQYEQEGVREAVDQMIISVRPAAMWAALSCLVSHSCLQEMQKFQPGDYLARLPPPPDMSFGGNTRLQAEYARVSSGKRLQAIDVERCAQPCAWVMDTGCLTHVRCVLLGAAGTRHLLLLRSQRMTRLLGSKLCGMRRHS